MAVDFSKTAEKTMAQTAAGIAPAAPELPEVKEYNIAADRQDMTKTLVGSKEVDDIVSTIEVNNMESVVTFGASVAEEISKASDVVLNSMSMNQVDDSGKMLAELSKIMSQFDIEEIKDNPGFLEKWFGNAKKKLDKILDKYHTMGGEVDKIYVQLKQYEEEIKTSNGRLNQLFEANVGYYHELVKYILAGEQGCKEIEAYIEQRKKGHGSIRRPVHSV